MTLPNPFPGQTPIKISKPKSTIVKAGKLGTLLVMILDESGSMSSALKQTISGYDEYIHGQKQNPEKTYVTLCKFEGGNIVYPYENLHIENVETLATHYYPKGGTNLYDAIGDAIIKTNEKLKGYSEENRPDVIINIFTDGEENSSKKYTNESVKTLVKQCEDANWTFSFFGANIDSFAVGSTFGMNVNNTFNYNTGSMQDTMIVASSYTTAMRSAKSSGMDTQAAYASVKVSDEDREKIK